MTVTKQEDQAMTIKFTINSNMAARIGLAVGTPDLLGRWAWGLYGLVAGGNNFEVAGGAPPISEAGSMPDIMVKVFAYDSVANLIHSDMVLAEKTASGLLTIVPYIIPGANARLMTALGYAWWVRLANEPAARGVGLVDYPVDWGVGVERALPEWFPGRNISWWAYYTSWATGTVTEVAPTYTLGKLP